MSIELSTVKYYSGVQAIPEPTRRCLTTWTKGIWVTCVLCCILGCYDIVEGGKQGYEHATASFAQPKRTRGTSVESYRLEKAVAKFRNENQTLFVAHNGFRILAGCGLLLGGALMMWRSPNARQAVFYACLVALCFHLSTAFLKVYQFASLSDFFEATGAQSLRRAGVGGASRDRLLQHGLGSMGFGHSLGVLFGLALPSLLYGRIMYFMMQPHVRETFAEDPYPEFRDLEEEADALEAIQYAEELRQMLKPPAEQQDPAAAKFDRV